MLHRTLATMLIATAQLGCATISRGEPSTEDKLLRLERSVEPSTDIEASVEQSGTMLHVRARWKCDLIEVKKIRRTTSYSKKNEALAPEVALLVIGAIPLGFGVGMMIDSKNVYEADRQSRLYNPTGPGGAVAGGVALVLLGTAMVTIPLVDLGRSVGSEEEEHEVSENGLPIQKDVPCRSERAVAGNAVGLGAGGMTMGVGMTNSYGQLDADLTNSVAPFVNSGRSVPETAFLMIGGKSVGYKVRLAEAVDTARARNSQSEDEAWQAINSEACRSMRDAVACQQVKSFLMRFPSGVHARDAMRILDPSSGGGVQIAASPEDIAKAAAAQKAAAEMLEQAKAAAAAELEKADKAAAAAAEKAEKASQEACKKKCESSCKKEAVCSKACVEEVCP